METEQLEKDLADNKKEGSVPADTLPSKQDPTDVNSSKKGTLETKTYASLRLRMQNAVSPQPCVGKFRISLVLLNFLHCNFRLWFETP